MIYIGFSSVTLGSLIILLSFSIGLLFCLFMCMILTLRSKQRRKLSSWSVCPQSNRAASSPCTLSTLFPTISTREPERATRSSTLSPSSPLSSSSTQTDFLSFGSSIVYAAKGGGERLASIRSTSSLPAKAVRPTSLSLSQSLNTSLKIRHKTFKLSSAEDIGNKFFFKTLPSFPSDTDESSSSPQLTRSVQFQGIAERKEKMRFRIGYIYIRLLYAFMSNSLQIDVLPNYYFPQKELYKESDLYVKLVVGTGRSRLKRSTRLTTYSNNPVIATFAYQINSQDLARSSITISLCKNLENYLTEGMLIGSGSVDCQELGITNFLREDFDSDSIKVSLLDSVPQQMIECGGFLKIGFEYFLPQEEMALSNIFLFDVNLMHIQFAESKGAIYLKIAVYEKGIAVCWRRTHPVSVMPSTKDILLADRISFPMTATQFDTAQVILSIRLKTGKRGERKILANLNLQQSMSDLDKSIFLANEGESGKKCSFKISINNSI